MNRLIQFQNTNPLFLITLLLTCFVLPQTAQAVSPAPDGGYPAANTAEGQNALFSLTTGGYNTAVGFFSLRSNTTGQFNTGVGAGTLLANTADENTATGAGALLSNTTGNDNTANGGFALFSNTEGIFNTAIGVQALLSNTTGSDNVADGTSALVNTTTGFANTAIGDSALLNNTTGYANIALGRFAGSSITTANNVICIGAGIPGGNVDNTTYIGNIASTSVNGGGADFVTVNLTTGLLGHVSSSRRYKEDIQAMDKASEALYRLKPVTYRFKKEIDPTQSLDYGLVAEDVANVDPNLATRDKKGQIESVRYMAVNAMLLNEFLKEHRKVEEQEVTIAQLKTELQATATRQQKQIDVLTAGLEKVSAQLEVTKTAPQTVLNNQ
jgi:hypothetical protein